MRGFSTYGTLCAAIAALLAAPAESQELVRTGDPAARGLTANDFPALKQLADGVYAWSDLHTRGYTTNNLIIITNEGVLVADGQGSPAATTKLVERIRTLTNQPIRYVVIGSDHSDHTGGNSAFPEGVTFIAHPTSRAALEASAASSSRPATAPPVIVPTETVADRRVISMGGKEIHILFTGRAHTGGDLQVHLPRERVLFLSEVFSHRIFPSLQTAYPSEWIEVLKKVQAINAEWYVPGHGFVDTPQILKEELANYQRAMETVVMQSIILKNRLMLPEEAVRMANWGEFGSWTGAAENAPVAVQRVFDEQDGNLPGRGRE